MWKHLIYKFIQIQPTFLRNFLIRKTIQYPEFIDPKLTFKIAETQSELEQAYRLLHDAYVSEGLMRPHPSGLRVTKYHALPSTTTIVAKEGDIVVGTVTLIRKSNFGMPIESIFDLSNIPGVSRFAEVSSLAIRKDRLQQRGRILFPLFKYLYHYCVEYFGVSHLVIAVNPKWIHFYEGVLFFTRLAKKAVASYSFVNGAPAIGAVLCLDHFMRETARIYAANLSKKMNLFRFFYLLKPNNFLYPQRNRGVISDPLLTPKLLDYFFWQRTDVMTELSDYEIHTLRSMYCHKEYHRVLPKMNLKFVESRFSKSRFDTQLEGRINFVDENKLQKLSIIDVSRRGLGAMISSEELDLRTKQDSLALNKPIEIQIDIGELEPVKLVCQTVRCANQNFIGFRILHENMRWNHFVSAMEARLIKLDAKQGESTLPIKKRSSA